MRVDSPVGPIFVTVKHTPFDPTQGDQVRSTDVKVSIPTGQPGTELVFESSAVCSAEDQFNKKFGRMLAARRLNKVLTKNEIDREIKSIIFNTIVFPPQKTKQPSNA